MDWAQKIIQELQKRKLVDDDATRAFCEAYIDGDSVDAFKKYSAAANREEIFEPNCYILLIFEDGSCSADWKEGVDRFYPDLNDLIDEDEDVAARFED